MSESIQSLNSSTKRKRRTAAEMAAEAPPTQEAFDALYEQVQRLEGALRHIGSLNGTAHNVFSKYGLTGMSPKEQGYKSKYGS